MKGFLKVVVRVLASVACVVVVGAGIIFGLRAYNNHRYAGTASLTAGDVRDIGQYPTDIDGVSVSYVDHGAFQGFHLMPDEKRYNGVVVCYGGSDGSPFFEVARQYAERGYETLSCYMFGMRNQPEELTRVPLEQFADVLDYIDANIENRAPVTLIGASKGAEYVLNLASVYDAIDNAILIAPVAYSFSGLTKGGTSRASSWTWEGEEVPYVDINKAAFPVVLKSMLLPMLCGAPMTFRDVYGAALEADENRDEKLIAARDVKGSILILVGEDDQMMDTTEMAELIRGQHADTEIHAYENAGHMFSGDGVATEYDMRMRLGGTFEGNRAAMVESGKVMEDFLQSHHGRVE